jgi:hypothetical protein
LAAGRETGGEAPWYPTSRENKRDVGHLIICDHENKKWITLTRETAEIREDVGFLDPPQNRHPELGQLSLKI